MSNQKVAKRWCFTLNNYTPEELVLVQAYPCKYAIIGRELGLSGTPHLQGYIVTNTATRLSALKKLSPRAHWENAKGTTLQNIDYCSKEGDFQEYGTRPKTSKEQGEDSKERWADVIQSAKQGTCDVDYPREFIQYNSTITRMYAPDVAILPSYTGLWWWGAPGSGKSRKARQDFPNLYDKLLNKWWDGYVDEEVVLIDDIDTTHVNMGLFLKRYADHYPFRAEYKGGSKVIRPKTIVVTSNYLPEDIFGHGTEMTAAIRRRYKVTQFHLPLDSK